MAKRSSLRRIARMQFHTGFTKEEGLKNKLRTLIFCLTSETKEIFKRETFETL